MDQVLKCLGLWRAFFSRQHKRRQYFHKLWVCFHLYKTDQDKILRNWNFRVHYRDWQYVLWVPNPWYNFLDFNLVTGKRKILKPLWLSWWPWWSMFFIVMESRIMEKFCQNVKTHPDYPPKSNLVLVIKKITIFLSLVQDNQGTMSFIFSLCCFTFINFYLIVFCLSLLHCYI